LGASFFAVSNWKRANGLEAAFVQAQAEAVNGAAAVERPASEIERKDRELAERDQRELLRLRGEVSELRVASQDAAKLRAKLQQLNAQNLQLRSNSVTTANSAAPSDQFPKESWNFAGYATPDAALVSAIWAMKEGDPKTYLESLSPQEQERMSKVWENKSEAEIAAKHQADVSTITGIRVLDRKAISAEEVQMNIYIQGVDRMEKVSMTRIDNEWKFGGFLRDPRK